MDIYPDSGVCTRCGSAASEASLLCEDCLNKARARIVQLMLDAGENPMDVESLHESISFLSEAIDEPLQCCITAGLVYGLSQNMAQALIAVTSTRLLFVCSVPRYCGKLQLHAIPLDTLERVDVETDLVSASLKLHTLNGEITCLYIGVLADQSSFRITQAFQAAVHSGLAANANH